MHLLYLPDVLRKHQTRNGVPATVGNRICVVRTEAHARRVPVHRAILNRLLHHVREHALPFR
jgi:hypothetical protein